MQWLLNYLAIAHDADMPILEALYYASPRSSTEIFDQMDFDLESPDDVARESIRRAFKAGWFASGELIEKDQEIMRMLPTDRWGLGYMNGKCSWFAVRRERLDLYFTYANGTRTYNAAFWPKGKAS